MYVDLSITATLFLINGSIDGSAIHKRAADFWARGWSQLFSS